MTNEPVVMYLCQEINETLEKDIEYFLLQMVLG